MINQSDAKVHIHDQMNIHLRYNHFQGSLSASKKQLSRQNCAMHQFRNM
jgi:hypothetical protein